MPANARQFANGSESKSAPGQHSYKRLAPNLAEPHDVALLVDVDPGRVRMRRQAWHRAHLAADRVDESRPDRGPHLPHAHLPAGRRSLARRVGRARQVRFGHADAEPAEPIE